MNLTFEVQYVLQHNLVILIDRILYLSYAFFQLLLMMLQLLLLMIMLLLNQLTLRSFAESIVNERLNVVLIQNKNTIIT